MIENMLNMKSRRVISEEMLFWPSYKRGNAILAVNIGKIKDFNQMTTTSQSVNICGLTKLLMANMII
ncbi:hypothetical protein EfmAA610_05600 [Enterococcus faecium]|nr:hypothetical protein EfmAA610_05600 [Enterococcus faecium]